jgi:hypothetical protein
MSIRHAGFFLKHIILSKRFILLGIKALNISDHLGYKLSRESKHKNKIKVMKNLLKLATIATLLSSAAFAQSADETSSISPKTQSLQERRQVNRAQSQEKRENFKEQRQEKMAENQEQRQERREGNREQRTENRQERREGDIELCGSTQEISYEQERREVHREQRMENRQ